MEYNTKTENEQHSLKYLDGLRGLAAFIVFITHLFLWFYPAVITGNLSDARNHRD
ncbi:MAG: hypothetical protein V9G25_00300 [Acidimicrobiia bacterium]